MNTAVTTFPVRLGLVGPTRVARWRPAVQWLLAIPHLLVVWALTTLRHVLTVISLFAVLFTKRIPRPVFDAIAMTHRFEWRAISYALFLHDEYPRFDFRSASDDDGTDPHTTVTFAYPEQLSRWSPLYKWILAVPHYAVAIVRTVASILVMLYAFARVVITGSHSERARRFIVAVTQYRLRIESYVGLLTDQYPPFTLHAA